MKIPFNKIPVSPAPLGIGLVVVALGIAGVFYMQRGAHLELKGAILKVRTQAMDENSSVAVIDFRFVNPSNYPFVVKEVEVTMVDKDGKTVESSPVSELDARRLFQYYPSLGQKFNDSLLMRDRIKGRESMDRMIVARFEVPESALQSRRKLTIRIVDVDGPEAELQEGK
jgi:hypothetical protein